MGVQGHRRRANGTSRYKSRITHEEHIHTLYTTTTPQALDYFSAVLPEYMQGPVMLMGLPLDGWEAIAYIPGEADVGRTMYGQRYKFWTGGRTTWRRGVGG